MTLPLPASTGQRDQPVSPLNGVAADKLASVIYSAAMSICDQAFWPRWFALREDLKKIYIDAAEQILAAEGARRV